MKIVHLCRWYHPHKGGVETHVQAISQLLAQAGHQVTVFTDSHVQDLSLQEKIENITVIRQPSRPHLSKLATWRWVWQHRQHLLQADIIQVHDVFWWLWPVYLLIRGRVFMTFHGWEGKYPIPWRAKLQRRLANWLSRGSLHVGAWIQEFYGDQPDAVIYGGVPTRRWPAVTPWQVKKKLQVAFVGRLATDNTIGRYISFLELLHQQGYQVEMTWVGDGPLRDQAERVGTVTGMVDDPVPLLAKADLVLASSYLSILQAQALGKVVVALSNNYLKARYLETFPGRAWVVVGTYPEQALSHLNQLLTNKPLLHRYQHQAATFARQQTWKHVLNTYHRLWQLP